MDSIIQQEVNHDQPNNKVTLWTRQSIKSLDDLKSKGVIHIKRKHMEEKFDDLTDYFVKLYYWFVEAASKKIPKPHEVEFPIWCSISEKSMLKLTEDMVVYVVEVDASEVIYFDAIKWDYVLNHLYIPKDAVDEAVYKKEMESKGHKNLYALLNENTAHFYQREIKQIMDSWVRIFEIDEWNVFRVQANIWEIRSDMVKDILYSK